MSKSLSSSVSFVEWDILDYSVATFASSKLAWLHTFSHSLAEDQDCQAGSIGSEMAARRQGKAQLGSTSDSNFTSIHCELAKYVPRNAFVHSSFIT